MSGEGPPGRKSDKARPQRGNQTLELLRALQSGSPAPSPAAPRAEGPAELGTGPADTIFVEMTPNAPVRAEPPRQPDPVQEPEPPFSQPPAGQQPVRARNPFGGHQADQRTRLLRLQERRRRAIGFWLVLAFLLSRFGGQSGACRLFFDRSTQPCFLAKINHLFAQ